MTFKGTIAEISKQLKLLVKLYGRDASITDIEKSARRVRIEAAEKKQLNGGFLK